MVAFRAFLSLLTLICIALLVPRAVSAPAFPKFMTLDAPSIQKATGATIPHSINNKGEIVGCVSDAAHHVQGFLLSRGIYTTLHLPDINITSLEEISINDHEEIAGTYFDKNHTAHGFLLSHGHYTVVDYPHAVYTRVFDINNAGDLAGIYGSDDGNVHGFIRKQDVYRSIDFPNADVVNVFGMNDKDEIVGEYAVKTKSQGFLLSRGLLTKINYPHAGSTIPFGINNQSRIVGFFIDGKSHRSRGFLWKRGVFTTIIAPITAPITAQFTSAIGINDKGQIIGVYQNKSLHGFLKNP